MKPAATPAQNGKRRPLGRRHHTDCQSANSGFDEDAFAGALLGALDHCIELVVRDVRHAIGTLRVALGSCVDGVAFLDVGKAVVEQGENIGGNFLAEAVARAEILHV